ncbi:MAG: hypothetical protein WC881_02200 [Elusimicrobiota bacterium]|jgi:hypothetical protein
MTDMILRHWDFPKVVLTAGFVLSLAVGSIFVAQNRVGTFNDDAFYYLGAKSIVESGRYANPCRPEQPPMAAFPIGFSLLLAPVVFLFRHDLAPLHAFQLLLFAAATCMLLALALRRLSRPGVALLGLWWLCSVFPAGMAAALMSDVPFLLAVLAALWLLDTGRLGAALAVAVGAGLIRPLGWLLVPAILVDAYFQYPRRHFWRMIAALAGVGLAAGSALLWIGGGGESVLPPPLRRGLSVVFSRYGEIWSENLSFYGRSLAATQFFPSRAWEAAAPIMPTIVLLSGCAAAAAAVGLWQEARRRPAIVLYASLYAVALGSWFLSDFRYLLPLRALLLLAVLVGFEAGEKRWPAARVAKWLCVAAGIYLGAVDVWGQRQLRVVRFEQKHAWISEHVRPADILADDLDGITCINTGRQVYPYFWDNGAAPEQIVARLRQRGVRYFVAAYGLDYVNPQAQALNTAWREAQRAETFRFLGQSPDLSLVFDDPAEQIRIYKTAAAAAGP